MLNGEGNENGIKNKKQKKKKKKKQIARAEHFFSN